MCATVILHLAREMSVADMKVRLLSACLCLAFLPSCSAFGVNADAANVQDAGDEEDEGSASETSMASNSVGESENTSSTETEQSESTVDEGGFVPDLPENECGRECEIFDPDGCAEGEKCAMAACSIGGNVWDSTVCRPLYGEGQQLDPCTYINGTAIDGHDECATGFTCWANECRAFCDLEEPGCPQWSTCTYIGSGLPALCLDACDPLDPSSCSGADVCIPTAAKDGFQCVIDGSGDAGQYGDTCAFANACDPGLICSPWFDSTPASCPAGEECCTIYCSLSAPNSCPGSAQGELCAPLFEPGVIPPGYEDIGVCAVG